MCYALCNMILLHLHEVGSAQYVILDDISFLVAETSHNGNGELIGQYSTL